VELYGDEPGGGWGCELKERGEGGGGLSWQAPKEEGWFVRSSRALGATGRFRYGLVAEARVGQR